METIQGLQAQLQQPLPHAIQNEKFIAQFSSEFEERKPRICAVLIILYPDKQSFNTIFIHRPDDGHVHSGQISFPGGGRESKDQTLKNTALREAQEEIGIVVAENSIIGSLSDIYVRPSHSLVTPYVAFIPSRPKSYMPSPSEVQEILELYIPDFLDTKNQTSRSIKLPNGVKLKFPAYNIDAHHIWGATAHMMQELLLIWGRI